MEGHSSFRGAKHKGGARGVIGPLTVEAGRGWAARATLGGVIAPCTPRMSGQRKGSLPCTIAQNLWMHYRIAATSRTAWFLGVVLMRFSNGIPWRRSDRHDIQLLNGPP